MAPVSTFTRATGFGRSDERKPLRLGLHVKHQYVNASLGQALNDPRADASLTACDKNSHSFFYVTL